jgi:hypothetical protein
MGTPLAWAQLAWMLVFRAAFWWAIFDAARRLWRGEWRRPEGTVALGFLGFLVLYSGFHVIGFAYERHVMPVVLPTALYLIHRWNFPATA